MHYFNRRLLLKFFLKKKFKNSNLAHLYSVKIDSKKSFYFFANKHHLVSKKKPANSQYGFIGFDRYRYAKKKIIIFDLYRNFVWILLLLLVFIFDLYWFRYIFKRSIEREPHTIVDKYYQENLKKSAYNYDLHWTAESWGYFDWNGTHRWTWWCFSHFSENYFNSVYLTDEFRNVWKIRTTSLDDSFLKCSNKVDFDFKTRRAVFDFLEVENSESSLWYSISEELNTMGSPLIEILIFPDSIFLPINWWFFFFI